MAPTIVESILSKRQFGYSNCAYYGTCNSAWYNWGRWVLLVAIVIAAVGFALMCSCFNARRRRRRGVQPMYGTGWLAGKTPDGHNGPTYNPGYNNGGYNNNNYHPQGASAPPYEPPVGAQYTGNTFNSNDGYYGQHNGGYGQNAVELQPPQHSYQPPRNENVYAPPSGPPPGK